MAIVQTVFSDNESAFGIEDDEVGVIACGEAAFAFVAAGKSCGSLRHPARDIGERETALRGFGVHQRKSDGKAGDAAPGGTEISFGEAFHFGWAGRMIGGDEVDRSVAKRLPQLLPIFSIANWWGAFEERGSFRNGFGGEMKIVRASFYSYGQTFGARGAKFRKSFARGEMDDVQAKFEFAAEREEHANRGEFGFFGARFEIGVVQRPIGMREPCCGFVDGCGEFSVDEKRQAGAGNVRQSGPQLLFGHHCETVDAGMNEKTFEAGDSGAGQRLDVVRVVGDDSAPGHPVDAAAAVSSGAFGFQRSDAGCGRQAI